ncbi:MAG TPA: MASE1 domain-containing protein, partial [Anaeromyxobacteraceae bacterium]|nr:MASE1 domain-containing protein [Anaeromyxobacteraceae bacterium]
MVEAETPGRAGAAPGAGGGAVLASGALYFAAAWAAHLLTVPGVPVAAVWLPVGVQVAAYALSSTRRWVALTAAFAIANILFTWSAAYPVLLAAAYVPIDLGEGLLGAVIVRRLLGRQPRIASARGLLAVHGALAIATAAGALLAAVAVAGALGVAPRRAFVLWWVGDFLGGALLVPAALAVPARLPRSAKHVAEAGALAIVSTATAAGVFLHGRHLPTMEFLLVPAWLWAALRFGVPAVGVVGAIHAAVALVTIRAGEGNLVATGLAVATLTGYVQLL